MFFGPFTATPTNQRNRMSTFLSPLTDAAIREKYKKFHITTFETLEEFKSSFKGLAGVCLANSWAEYGHTFLEICDSNMHHELVVLKGYVPSTCLDEFNEELLSQTKQETRQHQARQWLNAYGGKIQRESITMELDSFYNLCQALLPDANRLPEVKYVAR